jgi:hypothetical protein
MGLGSGLGGPMSRLKSIEDLFGAATLIEVIVLSVRW